MGPNVGRQWIQLVPVFPCDVYPRRLVVIVFVGIRLKKPIRNGSLMRAAAIPATE